MSKYQAAQRQWILKNQQLGVEQYLSGVPIKAETKFLDISTAEDSHLINDLIYYMNYSLAIFGWPMQIVDDPCMLCCIYPYLKLAPCSSGKEYQKGSNNNKKYKYNKDNSKKKSNNNEKSSINKLEDSSRVKSDTDDNQQRSDGQQLRANKTPGELDENCDMPIILEDNCCGCNSASAERRLASHNYEIIYISYRVSVNVVPFLVAADHSKQTIVVALRGSMSLSDMVTDMNGTVDKLPIENCPDDWLCHRGITRAASYVKTTLLEEHILVRAFNCRPDLGSQEYNLILCGHSLGAGVAAILGILLRQQYPSLKAYLYSPPGGILSMPVVEYTREFAVGIILGNDTVPRLGVAQLERLRYHTLLSLKSSQKSTGKILAKALCPTCCFGTNKVDYDPDKSLDLLYGTEGRSFDYDGTKIPFQVQPQVLYVPGKLIHIVKNYSFKSKTRRLFNKPIYQAIWTDNETYDRIMISEGMLFDHLPNNLMHAMKMLFSKTLPGRRESKSSTAIETSANEMVPQSIEEGGLHHGSEPHDVITRHGLVKGELVAHVIHDGNNNNETDENNNTSELESKFYPDFNQNEIHVGNDEIETEGQLHLNDGDVKISDGKNLDENGNERD